MLCWRYSEKIGKIRNQNGMWVLSAILRYHTCPQWDLRILWYRIALVGVLVWTLLTFGRRLGFIPVNLECVDGISPYFPTLLFACWIVFFSALFLFLRGTSITFLLRCNPYSCDPDEFQSESGKGKEKKMNFISCCCFIFCSWAG